MIGGCWTRPSYRNLWIEPNPRWNEKGPAPPVEPGRPVSFGDSENPLNLWCARQELNLRPTGSKSQPDETETQKTPQNQGTSNADE